MSQRPLGAQISHMLKDRGVEVIFGIPGVHNQEMYRGIEEAGLTHVLARHEQGAGFMADGYARATGKPGVAYVITGPGLCNIMTPMGQAYSDSVPMLVITSCLDDVAATHGQLHQMLDQEGAAATVCDWSQTARTAAQAYALIDRALAEFAAGRKRPKHITVPISVLGALADEAPAMAAKLALPPVADDHGLAAMLAKSKRPLFIFGGGCVAAAAEAREVLARSGAAAFTTYAGRGVLAPETPLNFGSYLARAGSAAIIGMADLVIAVGTELAEVDLWRDALGHNAPLLRVDIDPEVLSDRHRADFAVLGDAKGVLAAVLAGLP
ncbi:MAG: thiamine pyrophosphate-binding protein, partial [Planktomarina temperata]|nr:thiamine pyrophosphate-binding protein [Planktomarina temperata]